MTSAFDCAGRSCVPATDTKDSIARLEIRGLESREILFMLERSQCSLYFFDSLGLGGWFLLRLTTKARRNDTLVQISPTRPPELESMVASHLNGLHYRTQGTSGSKDGKMISKRALTGTNYALNVVAALLGALLVSFPTATAAEPLRLH